MKFTKEKLGLEVEEIELISDTDNSFVSDYYYVSELLKLEFKLTNNRSEE